MKPLGTIIEFTHLRNDDLLRVYREQLIKADFIIKPEIFARVAESPSIRFWISEERATKVIKAMLKGHTLSEMGENKKEMFEEIYRRYVVLREKYPDSTIRELIGYIVEQPAPKFYLTPRTVGEIIYRIKKGWYERCFERSRLLRCKR